MGRAATEEALIRAIAFDLDGTLVSIDHFSALNSALAQFGQKRISPFDHKFTFDGLPTKVKLELLGVPDELRAQVMEAKQDETLRYIYRRVRPQLNVQFALCRARFEGLRVAVASNAVRATVHTSLWRAHLAEYVELLLSNEDVAHTKPHPEIYEKCLMVLRMRPDEMLVVEDNPKGIASAEAAGCPVLRVNGPDDISWEEIKKWVLRFSFLPPATDDASRKPVTTSPSH